MKRGMKMISRKLHREISAAIGHHAWECVNECMDDTKEMAARRNVVIEYIVSGIVKEKAKNAMHGIDRCLETIIQHMGVKKCASTGTLEIEYFINNAFKNAAGCITVILDSRCRDQLKWISNSHELERFDIDSTDVLHVIRNWAIVDCDLDGYVPETKDG